MAHFPARASATPRARDRARAHSRPRALIKRALAQRPDPGKEVFLLIVRYQGPRGLGIREDLEDAPANPWITAPAAVADPMGGSHAPFPILDAFVTRQYPEHASAVCDLIHDSAGRRRRRSNLPDGQILGGGGVECVWR